jgi:hypothetical protein
MANPDRTFARALAPIAAPLPASVAAAIGNAIARHSYLDWVLGQVLYSLMEISAKQGRVVVRPPKPAEYVRAVRDLYAFLKLETRFDFDGLARRLERADAARHVLARCVYMRDLEGSEREIRLGLGPWASSHEAAKSIAVEGARVDRAFLAKRRAEIEDAIKRAEKLQAATDRLLRALHERRRVDRRWNRRAAR